jgi:hypothetical protein
VNTLESTMSLPTEPEALADLLDQDDLRDRLATQEGGARADRLLDAARKLAAQHADNGGPVLPRNRGGRPPVGDHTPGHRSKAGTVRLARGRRKRLDRLAEVMTAERIAQRATSVVVSRNDVMRIAVELMLTAPPKPGVIVQSRPPSDTEPVSFIPGPGMNDRLDTLSGALSPESGAGRLERATLIRWAVDSYLKLQEEARGLGAPDDAES